MEHLHEDYVAAGIRNQTAQEQQEFNLFAMLRPEPVKKTKVKGSTRTDFCVAALAITVLIAELSRALPL